MNRRERVPVVMKTFTQTRKEEKLIDAAVAFLRAKGWKLAVIGGMAIHHDPSDNTHIHTLQIRFTGTHPEHKEPRP